MPGQEDGHERHLLWYLDGLSVSNRKRIKARPQPFKFTQNIPRQGEQSTPQSSSPFPKDSHTKTGGVTV